MGVLTGGYFRRISVASPSPGQRIDGLWVCNDLRDRIVIEHGVLLGAPGI